MEMSRCVYKGFVWLILLSLLCHVCKAQEDDHDPTKGFTLVPLTSQNFKFDKPFNEPLKNRYSYNHGVRRFWIYNDDKPFKPSSTTRPRSEIRIKVHTSLSLSLSLYIYTHTYILLRYVSFI